MTQRGFSLIELMIVILLLGVLAALVIPMFQQQQLNAEYTVIRSNIRTLDQTATLYLHDHHETPHSAAAFTDALTSMPRHPWDPDHDVPINVDNSRNPKFHPRNKAVDRWGPYYYNSTTHLSRSRVKNEGRRSEKIEMYNDINNTNITSWRQTSEP